jgi:hypothetical protein
MNTGKKIFSVVINVLKKFKMSLFANFWRFPAHSAGLLRYKVDFQSMQLDDMDEALYNLDDY